mmetsp:Transcript_4999/g.12837  ORF Transcript_4999/g.12837 Transcript_4999/m.12837 type:complete len:154 (-) Transcript_4999:402-863(-)|eukprot:CAMPEP_0197198276 /NCGR_PEP_ID=MMETSP1423-20130617/33291_1 /TAXON_ID=476441 /ORGANISM="Pseudo-nitzschia heimii, Strain UNC1101" /LENGTH=153 /DNA_ID=CAMNT_0042652107 /DNA_START=146 /DNA_END=607 /DNA_ORIENTATION=+
MPKSLLSNLAFSLAVATIAISMQATISFAFTNPQPAILGPSKSCMRQFSTGHFHPLLMAESEAENQVVELADDETEDQPTSELKSDDAPVQAAPFLSQGEISEEALTMDWSDPKQQRVMFYIILSLLPVLFLIPLMLGSRELIPPELLPPVEL